MRSQGCRQGAQQARHQNTHAALSMQSPKSDCIDKAELEYRQTARQTGGRAVKWAALHCGLTVDEVCDVKLADAWHHEASGRTCLGECNNEAQVEGRQAGSHRGLAADKLCEVEVANAGRAKGVQAHVAQPDLELDVHGADGGERSAHGVPDRVQRRARVLCGHLAHAGCDVGLQHAVVI